MKFVIDDEVVLSRPLEGALAAHITAFAKWVSEQGYARCSRCRQVLLAARFSRWLESSPYRMSTVVAQVNSAVTKFWTSWVSRISPESPN